MDGGDSLKQYSLRWEKHAVNLASEAGTFFEDEAFLDCTLSAEGQSIQAHKIILSASSSYLSSLLKVSPDKHPILIFNDIKFEHLKALICFIYNGSVNVSEASIHDFINAAQSLLIKGLYEGETPHGSKRKLPELNEMKAASKKLLRPKSPVGKNPVRTLEKRHRVILPKADGTHVECEESLSRLEEISFKCLPSATCHIPPVSSNHRDTFLHSMLDDKGKISDGGNYVVKSWKHNSVDDLNGKQKHNKQYNIGTALFKKFKLDRPQPEPGLREEVDPRTSINHVEGPPESPPKPQEKMKLEEVVLVEPKQEVYEEEEEELPEEEEEEEEEEDTNLDQPTVQVTAPRVPAGFSPRQDVDREAVPVALLMCKTSLVEQDTPEPPWMGGGMSTPMDAQSDAGQDLPCPTCTKRYKSRYALNRHILYECGKARKSFSCDECGKKVTRQDTLQKHKLIHLVQHLKEKESSANWAVKKPA